jgi:hypothetical protein
VDFLVFLFEVKGLAPSTVKGYRSAISRTIHIFGGEDFGNNQFISLLVMDSRTDLEMCLVAVSEKPFCLRLSLTETKRADGVFLEKDELHPL